MKTQFQMFYEAQRNIADFNIAFIDMVNDGLTRNELAKLIAKRQDVYSRFSSFLDKLPD